MQESFCIVEGCPGQNDGSPRQPIGLWGQNTNSDIFTVTGLSPCGDWTRDLGCPSAFPLSHICLCRGRCLASLASSWRWQDCSEVHSTSWHASFEPIFLAQGLGCCFLGMETVDSSLALSYKKKNHGKGVWGAEQGWLHVDRTVSASQALAGEGVGVLSCPMCPPTRAGTTAQAITTYNECGAPCFVEIFNTY